MNVPVSIPGQLSDSAAALEVSEADLISSTKALGNLQIQSRVSTICNLSTMVAYRAEATRGDDLLELRNMLLYRTLHHRVYRALPQGRIFRGSLGSLLSATEHNSGGSASNTWTPFQANNPRNNTECVQNQPIYDSRVGGHWGMRELGSMI